MAAPKGNEFWRLADWNNPKKYQPDELWVKACEYFEWSESKPWYKNEAIKGGDAAGTIMQIPTVRPLTLKMFCIYAGITHQTFLNYEKDQAFLEVTTRIREITYTQKFEGAAVGAFNANIIARDLGLKEEHSVDHTTKGDKIEASPTINVYNSAPPIAESEDQI